jgi:ABC-type multidrug transport system fused ATPase/permease subunit
MLGRFRIFWRNSTIGRSASVLTKRDKKKIFLVMLVQITLGLLDLIGVALIGVLGALAITGVKSASPIGKVEVILETIGIQGWTLQSQVSLLGLLAAVFLVGRTFISIFLTRRVLYFLSLRGSAVTSNLISALLRQDLGFINQRNKQEILFSVTYGVTSITMSVLGATVTIISDLALLVILLTGLLVADPFIAASTLVIFGLIGFGLYAFMHRKARDLGEIQSAMNVESADKILDTLNLYREISLKDKFPHYIDEIAKLRRKLASSTAELNLMPNMSKYILETAVVVSALTIAAIQFIRLDAVHAIASLSIFIAAGSRIAPAVLRIQQGTVQIKGSLGAATPTLNLIGDLKNIDSDFNEVFTVRPRIEFIPSVELTDLTFFYNGSDAPSLRNVNLQFEAGNHIAIVGPSGGGKTTLVDCILGVLSTQPGQISISGLSPSECKKSFPGAIAYVPQEIFLTSGTIAQNVAISEDADEMDIPKIWTALESAQLSDYVRQLPEGINSHIGENGSHISGGQKQRLGIARALYSNPKLLVLDEATSAMDGQTEFEISTAIAGLRGDTTVVMIAHRLSTVQNADLVVYMANGAVVASGSFMDLKRKVPDFEEQARLLGL